MAIPDHVEGQSLLPIIKDPTTDQRAWVHGEMSAILDHRGVHYMTDGKTKYIWWSDTGCEQLFNLTNDPRELHDLASRPTHADLLANWRSRLAGHLKGRPEQFVTDGQLTAGRPHQGLLPHALPL